VKNLTSDLLAPGDGRSATLSVSDFVWTRIRGTDDPAFERAYAVLWAEFGEAHEMETREVLAERFRLGSRFRYEMLLVEKDGAVCAVRDHTAVWMDGSVVVHLSHVYVVPEQRRTGLAGWLRAAPIVTARELAADCGDAKADITLVGEMEYDDGSDPRRAIRLAAYEKAGYRKIDPGEVDYHQPDFRTPSDIDASGGPVPIPFQLIVRRVGREMESSIDGIEVRKLVAALFAIYGAQFRVADMQHALLNTERLPAPGKTVALVAPTRPDTRRAL
jgi:GNAT superfamily N-acetyltransferase